jgi:hypothetical protein
VIDPTVPTTNPPGPAAELPALPAYPGTVPATPVDPMSNGTFDTDVGAGDGTGDDRAGKADGATRRLTQ